MSIVKTYYSAAELAALELPGLPTSKGKMIALAERMQWQFVEKVGRGGKRREYIPPAEVVDAIKEKAARNVVMTPSPRRPALRPEDQLPLVETDEQSLKADARKGVLLALERLMARSGYPMKKAARVLVEMARKGQADQQLVNMLKMARDQRGRSSSDGLPSERSVLRFVEYERSGMLAPKRRERDMSVPVWAKDFLEHYQRPEKPTVEHAYRQFAKASADQATLPSVHQVRRFLAKVGNVTAEVGRMGERELKSLKPFVRRGFDTLLPSDVYSADGHTFDAEIQHPMHGRPFRPEITSIVDIATRRCVGWSIDLAESAFAVLDALRHACFNGGIPAIFYVDNGSGYKNQLMTDTGTGLMARLGIEMVNSLPYNSQARGVIERLHQTIWVNAAKELPGYIGREMDREARLTVFKLSRQALKVKGQAVSMPLMGWEPFVRYCEEKVAEYNDRPHRSLPKVTDPASGRRRHMTPNEAWALAIAKGFAPHTVADDEARPLFRPQAMRTVRRCEIELFGNRYFARSLEEFHSEQLRVGYDIHDPAKVWVYDPDGRFICTAELDANKRDYMPKSVVERARDKRAQGREQRLEAKLEEVREERRGAAALEAPTEIVSPGFLNIRVDELAERRREAVLVDAQPVRPEPVVTSETTPAEWSAPTTPPERWAEWNRMANLKEEEIVNEKQRKWRLMYQGTAEFRTYQRKSA